MDIGTLFLMLALAYGLGLIWYELLPGQVPPQIWRVMAYPFAFMYLAHALAPAFFTNFADPKFGGVYLFTTLVASLLGVLVDWAIIKWRHPVAVMWLEARPSAA